MGERLRRAWQRGTTLSVRGWVILQRLATCTFM